MTIPKAVRLSRFIPLFSRGDSLEGPPENRQSSCISKLDRERARQIVLATWPEEKAEINGIFNRALSRVCAEARS